MAVDFLRSCYSSEWQLFRDSNVRTKGRYYFADEDTPFYPAFHNLGSAAWHDRNWPHMQALGQVLEAPQVFYSGEPPVNRILARSVGSRSCIADGEILSAALPSSALIEGFNPECLIDEAWARVGSYNTCTTRRVWASLISQLYSFDDVGMRGTIDAWLEGSIDPSNYAVHIAHHYGVFPGIVAIVTDGWTAFALDGTSNAQEIALQAFAFARPPQDFGIVETASLWYQASTYILAKLTEFGFVPGSMLMCVGHSYGGAAALNVAARIKAANPNEEIRYLTFGSPKIGGTRFVDLVSRCKGWSIANDDDAVTVLPPDALEITLYLGSLGFPSAENWGQWQRPPKEIFQRIDGKLFHREPPYLDPQTLFQLASRVRDGLTFENVNGHGIDNYLLRTQRACSKAAWPLSPVEQQRVFRADAILAMKNPQPALRANIVFPCVKGEIVPGASCADAVDVPWPFALNVAIAPGTSQWIKFVRPSTDFHMTWSFGTAVFARVYTGPDCAHLTLRSLPSGLNGCVYDDSSPSGQAFIEFVSLAADQATIEYSEAPGNC